MNKCVFLICMVGAVAALDSSSSSSSDESDFNFMDPFGMFKYQYFSSEAKEVAVKLEKYLSDKINELDSLLDQLEKDNSAVDALKEYYRTVKSAENTKCSVETPKGLETAEETITTAADMCADTISIDDLDSVIDAVDKTFDDIENIDKSIRKNSEDCAAEENSVCAAEKDQLLEQINALLAPSVIDRFDSLIFSGAKEALDVCLQIVTEDLQKELDMHTQQIKACLQS